MTAVWNLWAPLVILLAELGKKFLVILQRANLTPVDIAHTQITIYGISALETTTTTQSVYTPIVSATTNFYIGGVNTVEGATTIVEEIIYSLAVVTNPTSTSTLISKLETGYGKFCRSSTDLELFLTYFMMTFVQLRSNNRRWSVWHTTNGVWTRWVCERELHFRRGRIGDVCNRLQNGITVPKRHAIHGNR